MVKILLIRHGESVGNAARRMMGHLDDGLTATGRSQCHCLGQFLRDRGTPPTHLYTSPLRRALESVVYLTAAWEWGLTEAQLHRTREVPISSAAPVGWVTGLTAPQVGVVPSLAEFQAGILTGLTWAEARDRYPDLCMALETQREWIPIPDAETPQQGRDRAHRFVHYLHQHHAPSDVVWIMSHQWILEHLVAALMGCDRTWQVPMPNTAIFEFWLAGDREPPVGMEQGIRDRWQIHHFGTCPHLAQSVSSPSQGKGKQSIQ